MEMLVFDERIVGRSTLLKTHIKKQFVWASVIKLFYQF